MKVPIDVMFGTTQSSENRLWHVYMERPDNGGFMVAEPGFTTEAEAKEMVGPVITAMTEAGTLLDDPPMPFAVA